MKMQNNSKNFKHMSKIKIILFFFIMGCNNSNVIVKDINETQTAIMPFKLIENGKYDEAIKILLVDFQKDSSNVTICIGLCTSYFNKGEFTNSLLWANESLALDSTCSNLYSIRLKALISEKLKKHNDATYYYTFLNLCDPEDKDAIEYLKTIKK
jgi:hypothetical protein